MNEQKLTKIFDRVTGSKQIHEAVLYIENSNGDFSYSRAYGGRDLDTPFLMASITKLLTTTCVLILREQGQLSIDDYIANYFSAEMLQGLHIYKDRDYSRELTISDLLFQTSGLPDIYEEGRDNAKRRASEKDHFIRFEKIIEKTKQLQSHFAPNTKRAHYADVNFDMLGKVIENITNSQLREVYKQLIFDPLELEDTYFPEADDIVPKVYYKNHALFRPKFLKSFQASGGCISTPRELMIFIKAFFTGRLFNQAVFQELSEVNKLQMAMYPIQYSAGYMKIPLHGLSTLFMGKGELIGHSGSTGSFAFYYPKRDLFLVGDVNQMANPALPVRLAMRLAISR